MIILTLGSLLLIGGLMALSGTRQYITSEKRKGKFLILSGALVCLLSAGFYVAMIILVASGT